MHRLLRDQSGQASAEYVLLLAVIVMVLLALLRNVLKPLFARLQDSLNKALRETFFRPGAFHRLRLGK